MNAAHSTDAGDAPRAQLRERMLEILVTHNEPVTRDDLACALGISSSAVLDLARELQMSGQATLDEPESSVAATLSSG